MNSKAALHGGWWNIVLLFVSIFEWWRSKCVAAVAVCAKECGNAEFVTWWRLPPHFLVPSNLLGIEESHRWMMALPMRRLDGCLSCIFWEVIGNTSASVTEFWTHPALFDCRLLEDIAPHMGMLCFEWKMTLLLLGVLIVEWWRSGCVATVGVCSKKCGNADFCYVLVSPTTLSWLK